MNNTQFYIAVAIPSVLVILSWIQSNARLARLESNADSFQREMRDEFRALRVENRQVRDELRSEIREVRGDVITLRDELKGEIRDVRGEVVALRDIVYRETVTLHERVAAVEVRQK